MTTDIDDYLDKLKEKYEWISREDLKRVLEHGFYTFYQLIKKGADVEMHDWRYAAYCGRLFTDNHIRTLYNGFRLRNKLHLKYKYSQEEYSGIYYFGLTEEGWDDYQAQIKSKKHKKVTFTNIRLYKIKEECFIDKSKKYFFMLNYPIDVGFAFTEDEITTLGFTYFAKRDEKNKIVTI